MRVRECCCGRCHGEASAGVQSLVHSPSRRISSPVWTVNSTSMVPWRRQAPRCRYRRCVDRVRGADRGTTATDLHEDHRDGLKAVLAEVEQIIRTEFDDPDTGAPQLEFEDLLVLQVGVGSAVSASLARQIENAVDYPDRVEGAGVAALERHLAGPVVVDPVLVA